MPYVAPADFREQSRKPWAAGLVLTENDASNPDLTTVIALVQNRVELDLGDDFEPPTPDNDEQLSVDGSGQTRLHIPKRVRSLTSVETLGTDGVYTLQTASNYRLHSSFSGGVMVGMVDWLDIVTPITTGYVWPIGAGVVRLTGKFGWAVVPDEIKRLTALLVYDAVKGAGDPITRLQQKTTVDAVYVYGESRELADIVERYSRIEMAVG